MAALAIRAMITEFRQQVDDNSLVLCNEMDLSMSYFHEAFAFKYFNFLFGLTLDIKTIKLYTCRISINRR